MKGIVTIRAFGWVRSELERNNSLVDTSQRPAYLLKLIQHWLGFTLRMLVAFICVILVALATQLKTMAGFTGASFVTLMSFGESVTYLIYFYTLLETSIGALARLRTFQDTVKPEDQPGEDLVPPETWPQHGRIEIKGVSASYG
jgi:ATP-binding cassette, subfamily C (CFTR/MRP), member 1